MNAILPITEADLWAMVESMLSREELSRWQTQASEETLAGYGALLTNVRPVNPFAQENAK